MTIYRRCEKLEDHANYLAIPDAARVELKRLPGGLLEKVDGEYAEIEYSESFVVNGKRIVITKRTIGLETEQSKDASSIEFAAPGVFEQIGDDFEIVNIDEEAEYAGDGFLFQWRDDWFYYSLYDPEVHDDTRQWDEITHIENFSFEADKIGLNDPYRFFKDKKSMESYYTRGVVGS